MIRSLNSLKSYASRKKIRELFFIKLNVHKDDVFLVSYPKSGNTWLRFMLGNYISNCHCTFDNCHLIIPDLHFNFQLEYVMNLSKPRIIKSHRPHTKSYPRVIYLTRDGRDVAVSYFHYLKGTNKISKNMSFLDFLYDFNTGKIDGFTGWSSHVNGWLDGSSSKLLLIKYEDMKLNPFEVMGRVINFIGLEYDEKLVKSAIQASSIENMRSHESAMKFPKLESSDSKTTSFIRKGTIGDWQNYFSEHLNQEFCQLHNKALKRLNYIE